MGAIAEIERQVYFPYAEERGAAVVGARYTGTGLRREEVLCYESSSDWTEGHRVRVSTENGRTWSDWRLLHEAWPMQDGFSKEECPFALCHDPAAGVTVQFVFQRLLAGQGDEALQRSWQTGAEAWADHNLWQVSRDDGRTWGEPHLLGYEDGPAYDPAHWAPRTYLSTNRMYGAYAAVATREGTVVYPASGVPMVVVDHGERETVAGVLCFIGTWRVDENAYRWEISERVYVPHRVSGRGLQEPAIAALTDGRLLLVMRGSNEIFPRNWTGTVEQPGRKWMSISDDGGRTWAPVTDLRYDSGEQFYSPSALCKLLRHSRTGKLYWFGNICPEPPAGNRPRYPLYIAEVAEPDAALVKDTLTVIDDRDPDRDSDLVQFSNFSVLENRETGEIELYMTRFGEQAIDWRAAHAYKYTIKLCG